MTIRGLLAVAATAAIAMVTAVTPVQAGTVTSDTLPAGSYAASRDRQYQVYIPDNLTTPAPMVMALHGCSQTQANALNEWGLQAAADQYGFILVTPFITSYDGLRNQNCWGFWFDQHQHENSGEPQDLVRIGQAVEAQYSVDPNRRYITGLSSGGAMTVVAAVAHNEYWAAAASASGLPYGEDAASVSLSGQCPGYATFHSVSQVASDMEGELDDTYPIPMMVLQSNNDCTVIQPAGRNIRDAHLQVFGDASHDTPAEAQQSQAACSPYYQNNYNCMHTRYGTGNGRSIVETVFFDGPQNTANSTDTNHGHYWVGGEDGSEGAWAVRAGPSYPDIIWDFFNRHSRNGSGGSDGSPTITLQGDNPMEIELGASFSDPGASATDPEDGSLSVDADCSSVDTSTEGDYTCTYEATDSDGNTVSRTRTVTVIDPSAPDVTCDTASASPSAHITAGRAVSGGTSNLRAFSLTDQQDIGASFDTWSSVTLYQGKPGTWYAAEPQACRAGEGAGDGQTCEDWYGTNLQHQSAGRAYYQMGYYTVGGDDALGQISGSYAWVRESSAGVFEAGQCP